MKYAYCPHCGYGGPDAEPNRFITNDIVDVSSRFTPKVGDDGSATENYDDGIDGAEVDWDSQRPLKQLCATAPLYACLECGMMFDKFDVHEEPSFSTTCPKCGVKDQLEVIFAEASLEGVPLTPDGFSFQDAKSVNTEDELVRCNACGEVFDLVEVTL